LLKKKLRGTGRRRIRTKRDNGEVKAGKKISKKDRARGLRLGLPVVTRPVEEWGGKCRGREAKVG